MPSARSHVTLALCTGLHAFTHAYGTMLVPLYLLIVADLRLAGVARATMLVTAYGVTYAVCSYGAGVLADRRDRKLLLGVGLIGNAAAVMLMGFTKRYDLLMALAVVAGLCGSLFHPAANALVPAHYPRNPGMAIGLLGIGSGIGFWAGPQFAGWRAESATWHLAGVASWQRPCVELGAMGIVVGTIFLFVAREAGGGGRGSRIADGGSTQGGSDALGDDRPTPPASSRSSILNSRSSLPPSLRWRCTGIAAFLSLREFAGIATISLASVYLQKALGRTPKQAGFILGTMMLSAVVANPAFVYLTRGARRLPGQVLILVASGFVVAAVPFTPPAYVLATLAGFYTLQLGSSAVNDAAMLERVSPPFRGRFVGLYLTIAGSVGALGPWAMGAWTDGFAARASDRHAYYWPFAAAGACMVLSALSSPLIRALGKPLGGDNEIDPLTETTPRTVGVVG